MNIKSLWLVTLLAVSVVFGTVTQSDAATILGAEPLRNGQTAHHVGAGWPSAFYEWWTGGDPNWGIGGELVYGDWVGEFSDVEFGFAANVPIRWHLSSNRKTDIAFKFRPGALIGIGEGGAEPFVGAMRAEAGIPITINVHPKANLITGGTVPLSVFFIEGADPFVVIPIMVQLGAEFKVSSSVVPFLLAEFGPAIAAGNGASDVEFGFRIWMGSNFW